MKLGNRREYTKLSTDWNKRGEGEAPEGADFADDYQEPEIAPVPSYTRSLDASPIAASAMSDDYSSVIGAESAWNGNFSTDGNIRIDGNVLGEVKATGTVFINNGADVKATVYGKYVIIAGSFDGNLYCSERLELQPESRIKGIIHTKALAVGEGAFIDGEIHMGDVADLDGSEVVASASRSSRNGGARKENEAEPL
ncbi:MAG TPA: polymer-forming cytoskeletal protein [Dehalococcoidia bacterium]|nr:polymer-forming cytoskeletal protein [Dehalococcoidia bacterium]